MALSNIQAVRLFISDRSEPYTFSDEDIQYFLDMSGGSVRQASILALYAIIGDLAKNKSIYRETTGDIEVWSNAIDWYKLLLTNFNTNPTLGLGNLMPYAAGIDRCDVTDWIIIAKAFVSAFNSCFRPTRMNGRGGIFSVPSSSI